MLTCTDFIYANFRFLVDHHHVEKYKFVKEKCDKEEVLLQGTFLSNERNIKQKIIVNESIVFGCCVCVDWIVKD